MAAYKTRTGGPIFPVVTTAGTPGTDDRVLTFQNAQGLPLYVRPCVITNLHASEPLYVLVNEEGASATNFLHKILGQEDADVSFTGRLNVNFVSVFYVSAAVPYTNVQVRGWDN